MFGLVHYPIIWCQSGKQNLQKILVIIMANFLLGHYNIIKYLN